VCVKSAQNFRMLSALLVVSQCLIHRHAPPSCLLPMPHSWSPIPFNALRIYRKMQCASLNSSLLSLLCDSPFAPLSLSSFSPCGSSAFVHFPPCRRIKCGQTKKATKDNIRHGQSLLLMVLKS